NGAIFGLSQEVAARDVEQVAPQRCRLHSERTCRPRDRRSVLARSQAEARVEERIARQRRGACRARRGGIADATRKHERCEHRTRKKRRLASGTCTGAHRSRSPSTAVPVTWSPSSFVARNSTSTI